MRQNRRSNRPTNGPRDHAGFTVDPSRQDYFAEPPAEIGPILSQGTTVTLPSNFMSPLIRWTLVWGSLIAAAVLGGVFGKGAIGPGGVVVFGGIFGALAGGFMWLATRSVGECSFVGELGAAKFFCVGRTDNVVCADRFEFRNAVELRTELTRVYNEFNGLQVYSHTNYAYVWHSAEDGVVFRLQGKYSSESGAPLPSDPFYFARSAEQAWTLHLLTRLDELKNPDGLVVFAVAGHGSLGVGEDRIEVHWRDRTETLYGGDLDRIELYNGEIRLVARGAKIGWFSSTGFTTFKCADLGNSYLFFSLAQRILSRR